MNTEMRGWKRAHFRRRHGGLFVAVIAAALLISACGGSDSTDVEPEMTEMTNMTMNMGDPDATRADEIDGGSLVTGAFELLDTRPQGYDEVMGTAWMARHEEGTTVTIEVAGLEPGGEYISHVHAQPCDTDNAGPHYQFEVGGAVMPPNEIHLQFTADADGHGFMTAENDRTVDDRAVAVVVHPIDLTDNKIACADF